jgi:signal transduction histidine kinase
MDNSKYQEYAADIFTSGQHLLGLISDILDVSKIEVGEMDIAEEPVDIGETINFCARMIKERADRAEIKLSVETAQGCPALKADERRLRQILLNLLSNAVKFTPPLGKVSIGAEQVNGGGIRLWVSDTGIGIAPEDIPRVMKPFAQLESPYDRSHEGTGLGLSLAKSLSEIQGGSL